MQRKLDRPQGPTTVEERLDALNAERHAREKEPEALRKSMESMLEAKAKKRRTSQKPGSSGIRRT